MLLQSGNFDISQVLKLLKPGAFSAAEFKAQASGPTLLDLPEEKKGAE